MKRLVLVFVLALATGAWADVPPRDASGCNGKKAGEACEKDDKSSGSCVTSTCSRNDYSNGPPPTQVSYECLVCSGNPPAETKKCAVAPTEAFAALALLALIRRRRA